MNKSYMKKLTGNSQQIKKSTLRNHLETTCRRRLINSEYQRGFMEGQQAAAKEFIVLIDSIMSRFDHVAVAMPLREVSVDM